MSSASSAARILGSKLASFVGLTEVLFAVLFAWLFLGQLPTVVQLIGGVLIIAGVALVRLDEMRPRRCGSAGVGGAGPSIRAVTLRPAPV